MKEGQCHGLTTKNLRCKIVLKNGENFCTYHNRQDKTKNISSVQNNLQRGFIYIYTLMHLLEKSPKKQDWLHVKRMNENNWSILDPQSLILIKIGMTSKSVAKRLNEWENKCNHRLISINPYCLKKNSILSLFKKLSISHGGNDYTLKTYDMEGQGFFTESNLSKIEKEVHSTLWKLYGKGDIVCHGCKIGEKIGIHKEWFLVKRTNLDNIFKLIDKIVIENSV